MGNNGAKLDFQIFTKRPIFHFPSVKNDISCETSTRNMVQNYNHSIFTQISPYLMDTTQLLEIFSLST